MADHHYYHHHHHSSSPVPGGNKNNNSNNNNNSYTSSSSTSSTSPALKARVLAGRWATTAGQVVQQWTARKYTLPDKNVASQVLMYRQLLHTKCKPGLKLSRDYQGTPAQVAVQHMPWWSKGCQETRKMEIAYDNLIRRLWYHGAVVPYESNINNNTNNTVSVVVAAAVAPEQQQPQPSTHSLNEPPPIPHEYWVSRLGFQQTDPVTDFRSGGVLSLAMLVYLVESCPTVHARFVRPDGDASVLPMGITSINMTDMMSKFLMLAKSVDRMDALLSQKPFWRMFADPNALLACHELSMDMLADVVVELRTIRLLEQELQASTHSATATSSSSPQLPQGDPVTVFDFAHILAVTEKRVEHDLLGAGPGSVTELKAIHQKLKSKYAKALQLKLQRMQQQQQQQGGTAKTNSNVDGMGNSSNSNDDEITTTFAASATAASSSSSSSAIKRGSAVSQQVLQQATGAATSLAGSATHLAGTATSFAGTVFSKIKAPGGGGGGGGGFNPLRTSQKRQDSNTEAVIFSADSASDNNNNMTTTDTTAPTITATQNEAVPDLLSDSAAPTAASTTFTAPAAAAPTTATTNSLASTLEEQQQQQQPQQPAETDLDGDWVDTAGAAAEQIAQFSIGDDEDDDI